MTTQSTLDILVKARERISSKRRWRKNEFATPRTKNKDTCQVCALGAISWARTGDPLGDYMSDAAAALHAAVPPLQGGVIAFNDAPATTHADVLALFDRAILAEWKKIHPSNPDTNN